MNCRIRSMVFWPPEVRAFRTLAQGAAVLAATSLGPAAATAQCPLTLQPLMQFSVPATPRGMAMGDFNKDGIPDVVCTNWGPSTVSVLLGNPAGAPLFLPTMLLPTTNPAPWGVAVGDFNGDGNPDIVTANNSAPTITVLLGIGNGIFQPPTGFSSGGGAALSVAVGDFNKDGAQDLVVSDSSGTSVLLRGTGTGQFFPVNGGGFGPGQCFSTVVGDFNADGNPDFAVAHFNSPRVAVVLGNGNFGFMAVMTYMMPASPTSLAVGDVNGDGRPDLAVAWPGGVYILTNQGGGNFAMFNNVAMAPPPYAVRLADLDRDGRLDLAVACSAGLVQTVLGLGNGFFQTPVNYPGGGTMYDIAVSDLDRDGRLDVLATADGANTISVLPQVVPVPTISQKPITQSVVARSPVSFNVSAFSLPGTGTMTYQWRRDGVNLVDGPIISGSQTATLWYLATALTDNGGAYDCIVTNGCGSARSDPAGLEVTNYCLSDIVSIGGLPPPDTLVTGDDFIAFINSFATGCP